MKKDNKANTEGIKVNAQQVDVFAITQFIGLSSMAILEKLKQAVLEGKIKISEDAMPIVIEFLKNMQIGVIGALGENSISNILNELKNLKAITKEKKNEV